MQGSKLPTVAESSGAILILANSGSVLDSLAFLFLHNCVTEDVFHEMAWSRPSGVG